MRAFSALQSFRIFPAKGLQGLTGAPSEVSRQGAGNDNKTKKFRETQEPKPWKLRYPVALPVLRRRCLSARRHHIHSSKIHAMRQRVMHILEDPQHHMTSVEHRTGHCSHDRRCRKLCCRVAHLAISPACQAQPAPLTCLSPHPPTACN